MSKYSSVALICSLLVVLVQAVPEGRIVRGSPAIAGQFPYQVSLKLSSGWHLCGGSIISKYYILTAAHCIVDKDNNYTMRGVHSIHAGTILRRQGGVRIPVAECIIHPDYHYYGLSADIALVRLAEPLTFSETIQPIQLASCNVPDYQPVTVSGWGMLSTNGSYPNILQWTVLDNLPPRNCPFASDQLLCLGHRKNNGACTADSGGPAVVGERLVGVCSFSNGGCGTDYPDGYVKVSGFFYWIKKNSDLEDMKADDDDE